MGRTRNQLRSVLKFLAFASGLCAGWIVAGVVSRGGRRAHHPSLLSINVDEL